MSYVVRKNEDKIIQTYVVKYMNPFDAVFAHNSAQTAVELFKPKIHIRIQQRNGRKSQTLVEGLGTDVNLDKVCKAWRNSFHANGSVSEGIVMIQGDQRLGIKKWLMENNIAEEVDIIVHG